jgi:hypothetical protein
MEMTHGHPDSMAPEPVAAGGDSMIFQQPSETNNFKERMR